jgi:hypothetical protein
MKPIKNIVKYVNNEESNNIHLYHEVLDNFPISNELEYIKYNNEINNNFYDLNGIDKYIELSNKLDISKNEFQTSLPIAIAITSYARIYMHEIIRLLKNKGHKIYYMDTDSIVTDKDLPNSIVGDKLGQFKLESICNEAYFISPKLYYLEDKLNNKTIIKARTLGGDTLTKDDFISMSFGINISKIKSIFRSNLKDSNISLVKTKIDLNPILNKRYPHYSINGQISHTTPLYVKNGKIQKVNLKKINTSIMKI